MHLWKSLKGHICHCRETEAWLLRRQEGKSRQGRVFHSEERFWAEGIPVLSLCVQGDSRSLANCPCGDMGCHQAPTLNSQKQLPKRIDRQTPSSSRMWKRSWRHGVYGEGVEKCPTTPHLSARVVCRDPVTSPFLWGKHWPRPRVCLSAREKGQAWPKPGDGSVHREQT